MSNELKLYVFWWEWNENEIDSHRESDQNEGYAPPKANIHIIGVCEEEKYTNNINI